MGFRDLADFLSVEPVVLPIRGRHYAFPGSVSARSWLRLQEMQEQLRRAARGELDPDEVLLTDVDEQALMDEMLGEGKQAMLDDGVTAAEFKAVYFTLLTYHLRGLGAAEAMWELQGEAKAPSPKPTTPSPTPSARSRGSRAGSSPSTPPTKKRRTSSDSGA